MNHPAVLNGFYDRAPVSGSRGNHKAAAQGRLSRYAAPLARFAGKARAAAPVMAALVATIPHSAWAASGRIAQDHWYPILGAALPILLAAGVGMILTEKPSPEGMGIFSKAVKDIKAIAAQARKRGISAREFLAQTLHYIPIEQSIAFIQETITAWPKQPEVRSAIEDVQLRRILIEIKPMFDHYDPQPVSTLLDAMESRISLKEELAKAEEDAEIQTLASKIAVTLADNFQDPTVGGFSYSLGNLNSDMKMMIKALDRWPSRPEFEFLLQDEILRKWLAMLTYHKSSLLAKKLYDLLDERLPRENILPEKAAEQRRLTEQRAAQIKALAAQASEEQRRANAAEAFNNLKEKSYRAYSQKERSATMLELAQFLETGDHAALSRDQWSDRFTGIIRERIVNGFWPGNRNAAKVLRFSPEYSHRKFLVTDPELRSIGANLLLLFFLPLALGLWLGEGGAIIMLSGWIAAMILGTIMYSADVGTAIALIPLAVGPVIALPLAAYALILMGLELINRALHAALPRQEAKAQAAPSLMSRIKSRLPRLPQILKHKREGVGWDGLRALNEQAKNSMDPDQSFQNLLRYALALFNNWDKNGSGLPLEATAKAVHKLALDPDFGLSEIDNAGITDAFNKAHTQVLIRQNLQARGEERFSAFEQGLAKDEEALRIAEKETLSPSSGAPQPRPLGLSK